jgi:AraC-like DNA-binding protein
MKNTAKVLASQMYLDREIQLILFGISDKLIDFISPIERLATYIDSTPFIHSIYLYNGKKQKIYTDMGTRWMYDYREFFDHDFLRILEMSDSSLHLKPIPRTVEDINGTGSDGVYTFLFFQNLTKSALENYIIAINISEEWMHNVISSMDKSALNNTFVIDHQGKIMVSSGKYSLLYDASGLPHIRRIITSPESSGFFVETIEGRKSLVSYVAADFGWKYIHVLPYRSITADTKSIRTITVLAAVLILCMGLLFAYFAAKTLYKPINKLVSELKSLEGEKIDNRQTLRQMFLKNFLNSSGIDNFDLIWAKFSNYGIHFNSSFHFILILFEIENERTGTVYKESLGNKIFKMAVGKRIEETASSFAFSLSVDTDENHIALIMTGIGGTFDDMEKVREKVIDIQRGIRDPYSIQVTAAVSSIGTGAHSLPSLFGEAKQVIEYKLFRGRGAVITIEDIPQCNPDEYVYPEQLEKNMISLLMLGKIKEGKELFDQILESTASYSVEVCRMTIPHLALSLYNSVRVLEPGSSDGRVLNLSGFIMEIELLDTIEDIRKRFYALFDGIGRVVNNGLQRKHEKMIQYIKDLVDKKYDDINLSVESIADTIEMSPTYLGRQFRKYTAVALTEYITRVRIKKAKKLLLETDDPINEISEKVGIINSSYFYTLFKKCQGTTPAEFRRQNLMKVDEH